MTPTPPPAPKKAPPVGGAPAIPPPPQPPMPEPEYVPVDGDEAKPAVSAPVREAWASYSPEEIQEATAELNSMKPEQLLHLRDSLTAAEKVIGENPLGEAGGVAWIDLQSEKGAKISLTSRAVNPTDALINLVNAIKFADHAWKFRPVLRGADYLPVKQNGTPSPQAQSASPVQSGRAVVETGTDILHSIEVEDPNKPSPRVLFGVGRFKHPFPDARIRNDGGAQTICDIFDKDLGWSPDHFVGPVYYAENQLGGLKADWEHIVKDGKNYYNVTRIHL